jgi:F-type H+-transporting ATPase subunit epsilon
MNAFALHLQSATQYERIENVLSFVGEDKSGSFGILPGHARMMTVLLFGLARFRVAEQPWEFLAVPGALVYFIDNGLYLSTRHYIRGREYTNITAAVDKQLRTEEEALLAAKRSITRLEEEIFKRLWKMSRRQGDL